MLSLKLLVFNDLPRHIFKRFYPHLRKTHNLRKVPLLRIFTPDTLLHQEKKEWVFFFQYIKHITSSWEEINYSDYIMSFAQAPKQERILNIELMKLFFDLTIWSDEREKNEGWYQVFVKEILSRKLAILRGNILKIILKY